MRYRTLIGLCSLKFVLPLFSRADEVMDLCRAWNASFGVVVLSGQLDAPRQGGQFQRQFTVERVLYSQTSYPCGKQIPVNISIREHGIQLPAGSYLLFCHSAPGGALQITGDKSIRLGPAMNYIKLTGAADPLLLDVQRVLDTLAIKSPKEMLDCIESQWPSVAERPFMQECYLRILAMQYKDQVSGNMGYYESVNDALRHPEKYHPETVAYADKLASGWISSATPPFVMRKWLRSPERQALAAQFLGMIKKDSPARRTLAVDPLAGSPGLTFLGGGAFFGDLQDLNAAVLWDLALVIVSIPAVDAQADRCTAQVENVLYGERLQPGAYELTVGGNLVAGRTIPSAGKYLMLVSFDKTRISCQPFFVGSFIGYRSVASLDDAMIADLQLLVRAARGKGNRDLAWSTMWTYDDDIRRHALLADFSLWQLATRTTTIKMALYGKINEIFQHPEQYAERIIVLADQLLMTPEPGIEELSDDAAKWQHSPERKSLFTAVKRRLTTAGATRTNPAVLDYANTVLEEKVVF